MKTSVKDNDMDKGLTGYDVCLVQDCNLRCRYCSTGYGRWGETPRVMARGTIDRVVTFMINSSAGEFRVSFSGGETLLAFDNLRYFIDRLLREKKKARRKVLIEVATNSVLLTREAADYLAANRVSVSFSLDGDRATTNRNRISLAGESVYDLVCKGIDTYRDTLIKNGLGDTRLKAECTVDEESNLFLSVIHLFDMGFNDVVARPAASSTFTGFSSAESSRNYLASFGSLVRHILGPLEPADILVGNHDRMLFNIQRPLISIISGKHEASSCQAISGSVCIMPNGEISPCFLFNGGPWRHLVIGDVFSGIDWAKAEKVLEYFRSATLVCSSCWCRHLCKSCYLKLIKEEGKTGSKDEPEYCRLVRRSLGTIMEEVSRRYSTLPIPSHGRT
jgi:radical SAM protein with 4Fe4S-binding SPASM domain